MKRLSAVDAEPKTSNQHEIGTTQKMRHDFLGTEDQKTFDVIYVWLGEDQDGMTIEGWATHYDARRNKPRAGEWRLYYPSNPVTEMMQSGDTLFLAKARQKNRHQNQRDLLWFIVVPEGSTNEQQLFWLFGLHPGDQSFVSREFTDAEPELDFAARYILDEVGIEFEEPEANSLDSIIEKFGTTFPKTSEFSQLARLTLPEVRAEDDPDGALLAWLDHEEALFRRLERRVVAERLAQGFVTAETIDVDGFLSFSLGVQNRRKSRMGHSLEHHIAAVLDAYGIAYVRGAKTEHNHKPDFLFPSLAAYQAAACDEEGLVMLAAKSSCKDRWRQVLTEAEKIPRKHLLTLQPSITKSQTDQMLAAQLHLVVPKAVQVTYSPSQHDSLLSVKDFINFIQARQKAAIS
ncbi:type II restriction endonuclease [Iodidimonas sp. MBR-14]|uniref:type II restriction endonuclease n=1 Tax=Iodidimonas sp. MBR-14 TaxID=3032319 RepID=UPI002482897C|nr:type II restriction endonuclease [Iodidimonas sp. MBR-14]